MATTITALSGSVVASVKKTAVVSGTFAPVTLPIAMWLTHIWLDPSKLQMLAYAIAIDFTLGFIKSLVLGTTSSRRIWEGIAGKVAVILGIIGIGVVSKGSWEIFGTALASWLVVSALVAEGVSIARNVTSILQKKELPEFNALAMIWTLVIKKAQKVFDALLTQK